jgi:uncharacterized protein (TIGR03435 family)
MIRSAWILLLAFPALAQTGFDVASVKPSRPIGPGETYSANLGSVQNGILVVTNGTLADCIKFAYGLVSDDQLAGPDWIKSKAVRFDVDARTARSTPREQALLMFRDLLRERFHLAMHKETRNFAHIVVTVAKGGSKMKEVAADAPSKMSYNLGHITHTRISMYVMALLLSRQMKQLVLDQTGLTGFYDIDLQWTPDDRPDLADASGPSIFRAVQEQLGLKLETRKDGVEVLVVDHSDQVPVAN